ncbi:unnamed protein product, partial [Hapterophycus canaliculatus]
GKGGPDGGFARGDRVEARYRGKGTKFYKGKISRINSDGTLDVAYDDGEKETGIAEEHVRSLAPSANTGVGRSSRGIKMAKGETVEARYRGKGTKFYKGKISRINSDGTLDVAYDDGEKEIGIAEEHVRSLEPSAGNGHNDTGFKMTKGERVEAKYRGKGTKFYKGKISRVNSDDTFDVAYDDGEKEIGIAAEHVRSLEPRSGAGKSRDGEKAAALLDGDKVEANFRGRGRYYSGRISRVNLDGTFNIDYNDGEKERGVTDDLIRADDRRGDRSDERKGGAGSNLQRGDKVEARYRGKGTKFYKGKISRVNSDGTLDISYDDGEKELGIALEHVNSLQPPAIGGSDKSREPSKTPFEGSRVEANFRGRGRFYPGRISRVHRDGTCDIDYDDGEKERSVDPSLVKILGGGNREGAERSDRLEEGLKVEAKYKGRSRYYPGRISRVHRDGTCDIDYDDGEKERSVDPLLVKILGADKAERGGGARLEEGMKVEAKYKGRSRYYPGRISRVHRDGTCDIDYDDGEKERSVDPLLVKILGGGNREGAERSDRLEEGMKVEAKYKGRSRYSPGRISRVHRDGTCD